MPEKNCKHPKSVLDKFERMGIETSIQSENTFEEPFKTQLYEHLLNAELFQVYRSSFEQITGHTVSLVHPDVRQTPTPEMERCNNSYCAILRETKNCAQRCLNHTLDLSAKATNHSVTKSCEGGITSSLIAISLDKKIIAYLRAGQVKLSSETISISKVKSLQENLPDSVAQDLKQEFDRITKFEEKNYVNQLVVLGAFSLQLSTLAEKAMDKDSPDSVLTERCKNYIGQHLTEKICLDTLAEHTKVTNSYMCKQFKKHTGLTIVEYINQHRIQLAKTLLLQKLDSKVIDIAYECGFQSLSQFNRTFQRYVSASPTSYRKSASSCSNGECKRS